MASATALRYSDIAPARCSSSSLRADALSASSCASAPWPATAMLSRACPAAPVLSPEAANCSLMLCLARAASASRAFFAAR